MKKIIIGMTLFTSMAGFAGETSCFIKEVPVGMEVTSEAELFKSKSLKIHSDTGYDIVTTCTNAFRDCIDSVVSGGGNTTCVLKGSQSSNNAIQIQEKLIQTQPERIEWIQQ